MVLPVSLLWGAISARLLQASPDSPPPPRRRRRPDPSARAAPSPLNRRFVCRIGTPHRPTGHSSAPRRPGPTRTGRGPALSRGRQRGGGRALRCTGRRRRRRGWTSLASPLSAKVPVTSPRVPSRPFTPVRTPRVARDALDAPSRRPTRRKQRVRVARVRPRPPASLGACAWLAFLGTGP